MVPTSTTTTAAMQQQQQQQHRRAPSGDFSIDSWGGNTIATHATVGLVRDDPNDPTGFYSCPKHPELCRIDQHTSSTAVWHDAEFTASERRCTPNTKP
jgi:hypothetical protein